MIVSGRIVSAGPEGARIRIDYPKDYVAKQYDEVRVELPDGRSRTPEQLRKAWALMGEIAAFSGDSKESVYDDHRLAYHQERRQTLERAVFRLSSATMEEASEFIAFLVERILKFDIPTREPLVNNVDDIPRYVYACLLNKKCAVCGKKADLHHVDRVGMGGDRRHMNHIGLRCLPACRCHHQEIDQIGDQAFMDKYHLEPVLIDNRIADLYRLCKKGQNHEQAYPRR